MDTPISEAEIIIREFWDDLMKKEFISVSKIHILKDDFARLLMKCEELRKSRDKWRAKYETRQVAG